MRRYFQFLYNIEMSNASLLITNFNILYIKRMIHLILFSYILPFYNNNRINNNHEQ